MKINISPAIMPDGTKYYNQEEIASAINKMFSELGWNGVLATGDNGSVRVRIAGDKNLVIKATNIIVDSELSSFVTGDGIQTGGVIIDGYEAGIYGDTVSVGIFGQSGFIQKSDS